MAALDRKHGLEKSWITQEEAEEATKVLFAGTDIIPREPLGATLEPGKLADQNNSVSVMDLSGPDTFDMSPVKADISQPNHLNQKEESAPPAAQKKDNDIVFQPSRLKRNLPK